MTICLFKYRSFLTCIMSAVVAGSLIGCGSSSAEPKPPVEIKTSAGTANAAEEEASNSGPGQEGGEDQPTTSAHTASATGSGLYDELETGNERSNHAQNDKIASITFYGPADAEDAITDQQAKQMAQAIMLKYLSAVKSIESEADVAYAKIFKASDSINDEKRLIESIRSWRPGRQGNSLPLDARLIDIAAQEELDIYCHKVAAYYRLKALRSYADRNKLRGAYEIAGDSVGILFDEFSGHVPSMYSLLVPGHEFLIETASDIVANKWSPYGSSESAYASFKDYVESAQQEKKLAKVQVLSRERGQVKLRCQGVFCKVHYPYEPEWVKVENETVITLGREERRWMIEWTKRNERRPKRLTFPYECDGDLHLQLSSELHLWYGSGEELTGRGLIPKLLLVAVEIAPYSLDDILEKREVQTQAVGYTDTLKILNSLPQFTRILGDYERMSRLD